MAWEVMGRPGLKQHESSGGGRGGNENVQRRFIYIVPYFFGGYNGHFDFLKMPHCYHKQRVNIDFFLGLISIFSVVGTSGCTRGFYLCFCYDDLVLV